MSILRITRGVGRLPDAVGLSWMLIAVGCQALPAESSPEASLGQTKTALSDSVEIPVDALGDDAIERSWVEPGQNGSVDVRVNHPNDDAEESRRGRVFLGAPVLELFRAPGGDDRQVVGIRFRDLGIPTNAIITGAHLELFVARVGSGPANLSLRAEASDNAAPFTARRRDITRRELTDTATNWLPAPWRRIGERVLSPDISALVQEVVNRDGWNNGNALAIVIEGSGSRAAFSFEGARDRAPLVHIDFKLPTECGDGFCDPDTEDCSTCPADCGECCGDGFCDPDTEDCSTCPADCGECCGDGFCNPDTEDCSTCPADCGECCGDGFCNPDTEDCSTCPADCGACEPVCGDGSCNGDETCIDCPADCGECPCGDGICEGTENCLSCSEDCGECPVGTEETEARVSQSSDDAEERVDDGAMSLDSSDLELIDDSSLEGPQLVGIRFDNLAVPPGATVTAAYIAFTADEIDRAPADLLIQGEAVDDAATYLAAAGDISGRARTAASVGWSPEVWNTVGSVHQTPDLSTIIQTIVNRPGWMAGNALAVIITGTGERTAESFDGSAGAAPLLHVAYLADPPTCGDGICNGDENCDECPDDCGACFCGNGRCDAAEDCESCEADCGVCPPEAGTVESRVSTGNDDAEELENGSIDISSSDLELVNDSNFNGLQVVGMRFAGIEVPAGSYISSAYIEFTVDEIDSVATDLIFQGQLSPDPVSFTVDNGDITARPLTVETVAWSAEPWTTVGETHQTPDLAPLIQEIVDQPGWGFGNAMVIIVSGSGERTAESYEGSAAAAPLLHIAYTSEPPYCGDGVCQADEDCTGCEADCGPCPSIREPALDYPPDREAGVATSPTLAVTLLGATESLLSATFFGREKGDDTWTLIALPDTQNYTQSYPDIFMRQAEWIVDNRERLNIQAVMHEGDIVNVWNSQAQFDTANAALSMIMDAGIPLTLAPGNHDHENYLTTGSTQYYSDTFPAERFEVFTWWEENADYNDNNNNYLTLHIGEEDYLLMGLDYCPDPDEISWADTVLSAYPNHKAILVTHALLSDSGTYDVHLCGNTAYIFDDLISQHRNLQIVLCGHVHTDDGEAYRADYNNYDGLVHQILANYQSRESGGNGRLRIMTFEPSNDKISIQTYSPYTDSYETDASSQFEIEYEMADDNPFVGIGGVAGLAIGQQAGWVWSGLSPETTYEWYVEVTDGMDSLTSPVWEFTTGL